MKRMPKNTDSQSSFFQLSLPLYQKPFLEMKKKVRGKNRKGFDLVEQAISYFQIALDKNEIHSVEARSAIREFLAFVLGHK